MSVFFFHAIILFLILRKALLSTYTCTPDFHDCFNCSTCGEQEVYYQDCLCSWDSNSHLCNSVTDKTQIFYFYQAFSSCQDSPSNLIKEEYCGSSTITLEDEFTFSLPVKYGKVGTRSIFCEYKFIVSDDDDIYYNINYKYYSSYSNDLSTVNLYLLVTYDDSTSTSGLLQGNDIDKDFYSVKEIQLKLYFEHSFSSLPFSFVITKKNDNSKLTLYITIGVIILSCILCALAIYCLSKKISENARLRQRALFDIAMAHQNGEEIDDEESEQKRIENENKLKIKFALKHSLKPKRFLKKYGTKDGNTCTICIEDFKEKVSKVSITPCKHVFHYQCLSNWLVKNVMNPKCPNCNYNLIQNVKDSDIKDMVIPETIHVNKAKINVAPNAQFTENNNDNINEIQIENVENENNIGNVVNVDNTSQANANTEDRNLRTSNNNVVIVQRNNLG